MTNQFTKEKYYEIVKYCLKTNINNSFINHFDDSISIKVKIRNNRKNIELYQYKKETSILNLPCVLVILNYKIEEASWGTFFENHSENGFAFMENYQPMRIGYYYYLHDKEYTKQNYMLLML